jgi:cobalt-zinc-cadmium efflux system outer membrane protein
LACARAGLAEAPVSSQTLTVDEAVREAIDRNLSLVAERFSVDVAQARIATAALRPNPVVTVNALLPDGDAYDNTVSPREEVFRTDVVIERGGKRNGASRSLGAPSRSPSSSS